MFAVLRFGCLLGLLLGVVVRPARAQPVPSPDENISYLVTFGAKGAPSWGDDDHCQTMFFLVPKLTTGAVYIRVFDPECGGAADECKGIWNTTTDFSVYGGAGAHSSADARGTSPRGSYRAGNLLMQESYAADAATDQHWASFGPFDPKQGELVPEFDGYVFKVVVEGKSGDDGNLYAFYLSSALNENVPIEGGNGFTYEYAFRLPTKPGAQVHLYPFIGQNVVSIKQSNFDADADGQLRLYSVARNGQPGQLSGDNQWSESKHLIDPREKGLSLDMAYTKKSAAPNDVVFYVTDQYDRALPFFAVPLGGKPRYHYTVNIRFK
ncbi:MAG: hypothetical protein H7330_16310 [Hymenobacteraceae bacterium]|nr:hypothetical protein [Hymenobacteraceae bacterium]